MKFLLGVVVGVWLGVVGAACTIAHHRGEVERSALAKYQECVAALSVADDNIERALNLGRTAEREVLAGDRRL